MNDQTAHGRDGIVDDTRAYSPFASVPVSPTCPPLRRRKAFDQDDFAFFAFLQFFDFLFAFDESDDARAVKLRVPS